MHWKQVSYALIKDIALTGTGLTLILSQLFSVHPSDVLLVTGLALTVPSIAGHAREVLSGNPGTVESPPPSSPPPGSLQLPPLPESGDDEANT